MTNTNVINELAGRTGETAERCEAIVKGFEKASEIRLENKFRRQKGGQKETSEMVSELTGIELEVCKKILEEMGEVLDTNLSKKLRFKK